MAVANCDDIIFNEVQDEALLQYNHTDAPVYIPSLKTAISVGHYVSVRSDSGNNFIAQIIRSNATHVTVCPFLPLYSESTQAHINNPLLLPLPVQDADCHGVVELVKSASLGSIRASQITEVVYIFLVDDITSCQFHILGMRNAFIIRYKYCFQRKQLVHLDHLSFHCFPDLADAYRNYWGECYSRSIFSSIEYLRQEIWRNLCRYGEKQGLFLKPMFKAYVSPNFTSYLTRLLNCDQIPSHLVVSSVPQRPAILCNRW
jgi:hypothetical protein